MPWPVLRWSVDEAHDLHDLVDRMKVTEDLVRVRLTTMHPAERVRVLQSPSDEGSRMSELCTRADP